MRAFVTLAASSLTVDPVASRVCWNNPLFRRTIRGIGVEKAGIMMRIAAAVHSDHLMLYYTKKSARSNTRK